MKPVKSIIISLLLMMTVLTRTSGQGSDGRWSLDDCMRYAVQNSSSVKRQAYANDNYRQDYIQSIADLLPNVNGSSGTRWGFGRNADYKTNQFSDKSTFNNDYSVSGSMTLFGGFSKVNNIRMSRVAILRGVEETQRVADDIALATMEAFIEVVYYIEAIKVSRSQLEESEKLAIQATRYEELGLKSRPDVAQIESQLATSEYNLIVNENMLVSSLLKLKDQMSYPIEEPLEINPVVYSESGIFQEDAHEIFLDARNRLPGLKIADLSLRESELSLAIARGNYYPTLSANTGWSTQFYNNNLSQKADPFHQHFKNNAYKYVGISLSIPIFQRLSIRSNVTRTRNHYKIAQEDHGETMRRIEIEIHQAVLDVEGMAKELSQSIKKVQYAEIAHRAQLQKYEQGLISTLELQTSNNEMLSAKVENLNIQMNYLIKCRLPDFYKGIPFVK